LRSWFMYCWAWTYFPSYSASASINRQSAPLRTASAPTCASPSGWLPYTYCHAHTRRPLACKADTRRELNCDHTPVPSPALIINVLRPYRRDIPTIEDRLPPFDAETYQIHMPRLANGLDCAR